MMDLLHDARVALAKETPSYCHVPPYHPSEALLELPDLPVGLADNPAWRAIRRLFELLELDRSHQGSAKWNPLGELIQPGNTVLLKPNFVSHFNMGQAMWGLTDTDSLVTHGSVIRVVLEYVAKALRGEGRVFIGDCPIQGTRWEQVVELVRLYQVRELFRVRYPNLELVIKDYRLGRAEVRDGIVIERTVDERQIDQYEEVELGRDSLLMPLMTDGYEFGVSQYPRHRMRRAHTQETNRYLIPKDVLSADVIINLPKMKTHIKAGITGALKNLVGINGHKDYLPHFRFGSPKQGGDEYPDGNRLWDMMWFFAHQDWELDRGRAKKSLIFMHKVCDYLLKHSDGKPDGSGSGGGGSWYGNDTLWRTILDINRALFYYDPVRGEMLETPYPNRRYLAIMDGLIGGQKEGPLTPTPMNSGVMLASFNPLAMDSVQAALMGFDVSKIKQIAEGYRIQSRPLAAFSLEDVEIKSDLHLRSIDEIYRQRAWLPFVPPEGWRGHIEYERLS